MGFDEQKFIELLEEGNALVYSNPKKAIKKYEQAGKMAPSTVIPYSIGIAYKQWGKDKDAIKSFGEALNYASYNNGARSSCEFGMSAAVELAATYIKRNDHNGVVQSASQATGLIQHVIDMGWQDLYPQAQIAVRKLAEYQGQSYYNKKKWAEAYQWYSTAAEYGSVSSDVHNRVTELQGRLEKSGINWMELARLGVNFAGLF